MNTFVCKSGIYKITCAGCIYVGSAVNIKQRWNLHRSTLFRNKHHSPHMQNVYNKYGIDVFSFEILEYVEKEQLVEREQYWLDWLFENHTVQEILNTFRNATSLLGFTMPTSAIEKRRASVTGQKRTPEQKERIRQSKLGIKRSPECIEKMRISKTGVKQTKEAIEKRRIALTGKKHSDATKEKIRLSKLGVPMSDSAKENMSRAKTGKKRKINETC